MQSVDEELKNVGQLYSMPNVLSQAYALLQKNNTEASDLVDVLKNDPTIVVEILRLVNSAYYSPAEPIADLQDAVQFIGFREVMRLIGFKVSSDLYEKDLDYYRIPPVIFWESSMSVALLMVFQHESRHLAWMRSGFENLKRSVRSSLATQ